MKNENIGTNITNETIYSTNVHEEENVSSEVLTDNQIDATMSASDIQSGEAELVLMQPLDETASVNSTVECFEGMAARISKNVFYSGCITSETLRLYYKFETIDSGIYTIHTLGDVNLSGTLYDNNGTKIEYSESSPNDNNNFRIKAYLNCNSTYYIEVASQENDTGCFSVRVTDKILVDNVSFETNTLYMTVGQTIFLPTIVTVLPENADEKNVNYICDDCNVVSLSQKMVPNNAGILTNLATITAKSVGTTIVKGYDFGGDGRLDECTIIVNDILENDEISWADIGFTYDSSIEDSFRQMHNLPPRSYDQWIMTGRQKVVYLCDYSDIPFLGHAMLLIRNSAGEWYKTQFMGTDPKSAFIDCRDISEEEKNEYLIKENMDHIFLYGDYYKSLENAENYAEISDNNYNGKYDPINNNCLHYINEILSYGNNIDDRIDDYIHNTDEIIPKRYYDDIIEIINS